VMAFGDSLDFFVVCMENIPFTANLVSGLLGVSNTSGENWRFSHFFLAYWLTTGS
jgi:hypothetical protein